MLSSKSEALEIVLRALETLNTPRGLYFNKFMRRLLMK